MPADPPKPRRRPAGTYWRGATLWGRLAVAGVEHRRSLRTADPAEARLRLRAWRQQVEREQFGAEGGHTYQEAVIRWEREVVHGAYKPATARRYLTSLVPLDGTFGPLRLSQITTGTIAAYIASRAGRVSNATIRRDLTALSRLLSACVAWGWRDDNPARSFDRSIIRERREPVRPPDPADVATFLAAAPPVMARIAALLAATGMRENEVVQLERVDVDWQRERINLTRTKATRPRSLAWRTPAGDAEPALRAAVPMVGTTLLFPLPGGEAYRNFASDFGAVMRRLVARELAAGRPFRRFRAHDLRHGFAIRWLRQGGDIYRLSKHLGHTSVKTTEGYLAYLTGEEQEASVAQEPAQKALTGTTRT